MQLPGWLVLAKEQGLFDVEVVLVGRFAALRSSCYLELEFEWNVLEAVWIDAAGLI